MLSAWCYQVGEGTAVAMFLVGAVAVWSGYELSIQVSVLSIEDAGNCNSGISFESGK